MTSPFTSIRCVNLQNITATISAIKNKVDDNTINHAGNPANNKAFPLQ